MTRREVTPASRKEIEDLREGIEEFQIADRRRRHALRVRIAGQAAKDAVALAQSRPGRGWPLRRWREAHLIFSRGGQITAEYRQGQPARTGAELLAELGIGACGPAPAGLYERICHAVSLYERAAEHRPANWPAAGAAAFCHLAARTHHDRTTLDIANRLLHLARDMNAERKLADPNRPGRQHRRADNRKPPVTRISFRLANAPVTATEAGRQIIRDRALLDGQDITATTMSWAIDALHLGQITTLGGRPNESYYSLLDGAQTRAERYKNDQLTGIWGSANEHQNPWIRNALSGHWVDRYRQEP